MRKNRLIMGYYLTVISKYLKYVTREEFDYDINISLKNKYIYVETPKVGCSTIKDTLQRMEIEYPEFVRENFEDIHYRDMSPLLKPSQTLCFDRMLNNPEFFVFCFARNPYTRLLSSYLDKIVRGRPHKRSILVAMGLDSSDLSINITFREFVDVVCNMDISHMDPHWRIQYYQTFQDQINYDFIGKFESFQRDCAYVFNKLNVNYNEYFHSELRHATNSSMLLNKYYDKELRSKVFQKYLVDFEFFNYAEELPCGVVAPY